jgi:hypothetical protein
MGGVREHIDWLNMGEDSSRGGKSSKVQGFTMPFIKSPFKGDLEGL